MFLSSPPAPSAGVPYTKDLERIYASSDFCIVPFGDTFSSRRTFDAMRMGCVPVLTSPLMQLPFPDRIDYGAFVAFIDAGIGSDIGAQLDALAAGSELMSTGSTRDGRGGGGGINGGLREPYGESHIVRRRRAAVAAAKALAMEDCGYARGVGLAVEAAGARAAPLRATFTAQPSVKGRGYAAAGVDKYLVEW